MCRPPNSGRLPKTFEASSWVRNRGRILELAAQNSQLCHRAAYFVDRILKGANPPISPSSSRRKFSLIINLKTAKALGLTIPQSLLVRADQVIE